MTPIRRPTVLTFLVLATSTAVSAQTPFDPEPLLSANRALKGHRAIIELNNGEVFTEATAVFIGAEWTTWEVGGETGQARTSEVDRVSLPRRARVSKWARRGAMVGAVLGGVGGGYSEIDGAFIEPLDPARMAKGALAGAGVGAAAGSVAGGKVVFTASDDRP